MDRDDVTAGGDEAGGVEVAEVVQLDVVQPSSLQRLAPPVPDTVLMRRLVAVAEQPLLLASSADFSNVLGDEID